MSQPIIEIKHLKKSYGQNEVLKDISLSVNKGEVISSNTHNKNVQKSSYNVS